jgi:hypothetical protein
VLSSEGPHASLSREERALPRGRTTESDAVLHKPFDLCCDQSEQRNTLSRSPEAGATCLADVIGRG